MEIDITTLAEMNAFDLSHSIAEGGENAMHNTWQNSKSEAERHAILNTPEKLAAMREFAKSSGSWTREEIADWPDSKTETILQSFKRLAEMLKQHIFTKLKSKHY